MNPSSAGSRVSVATMVSSTPMAAAAAIPVRKVTPRVNIPSRATHTITPASSTARPEVLTAVTTDSSGATPARSPCRWRLTMNRA